ncbi:TonB-dependent receptor [Jejuia pallidilutea]|uniref:Outer membrane vitamin B12 receptor BtuB n=1 Tax=Jejuia pallidilutea TaxID=504487 RepID=A0A090WVD6_9FLAO|nr:outer membrane vitamin B12 receptor BtuB [Jejuia pallidilutea]
MVGFAQEKQADSTKVQQLDEVVISDSRFELKRENSGKTVIKISQQEIERNQGRTLADVINTKSGIEVNGSRSVAGQNISSFVRGGNNRQVLVLVDGVQINDPSLVNNEFDLRLIDLNTIASIEIVKGAASTLYGNAAATAVINITTKKPPEMKFQGVF